MSKKNIFITIIVVVFLIAGTILMFSDKEDVTIELEEDFIKDISLEEEKESQQKIVDPLVILQKQLENRARFFIERYNTYSSDSNQENLYSLLPQVSDKLEIDIKIQLMPEVDQNDVFFGIQTKVLSIILSDFITNEKAIFESQVQIEETEGETTKIDYKTVTLEFIYENEEWKVNDIN